MITSAYCTSFKAECYQAIHNLTSDVIKLALYTSTASLDATTTIYTTTNEVSAAGYTAGGVILTGAVVATSGTTAYVDFNNAAWPGAVISAAGALMYNSSKSNKAICVLYFGQTITSKATNGFTVVFPAPNATYAILRTQ